jgi:hypothetical protein
MKMFRSSSATHRTHFFSALCRSLFTNACWIFSTSLFVKVVGSKGYSQLFFFASLTTLTYYVYFALRGQRTKEPYNVYRATLIFALVASVGCFLEPFWQPLVPYNQLLLYLFVVSVMTVDLVGTTLGPMVLQASVNPAIFRKVYSKIITLELIARISAAALVWLLSQGHLLNFLYPFAWVMLLSHFVLFDITVFRMRVSELKSGLKAAYHVPVMTAVVNSLHFVFKNPLVRVAMLMMVWATVSKFVLENLFYQAADAKFHSARQIAAFVSVLTMFIYALSLALHHLIVKHFNSRFQLSTLLTVQPINILVLGGLALLLPPFWPLVVLMVTYNIIHRSIHLPMSRQCMVPIPRRQRATIVSLISIVVAIVTMVTSGVMAILKDSLHLQDFLFVLLLLGASILFVITSLDSYYIRNLWSFFQEARSGSWQDEPQSEALSAVVLEEDGPASDAAPTKSSADLSFHPILATYAYSRDPAQLRPAVEQHRALLKSNDSSMLLPGLQLCFATDFPWLRSNLSSEQATSFEDSNVQRYVRNASEVNEEFSNLPAYSSVFRRRIRALAMELREKGDELTPIRNVTTLDDHDAAESIVAVLVEPKFNSLRNVLFKCMGENQRTSTIEPLIARMYELDYGKAQLIRDVIEQLRFGRKSSAVRAAIEAHLSSLKSQEDNSKRKPIERISQSEFMHTLFLEEYRLYSAESDSALTRTIGEFPLLSPDESAILIDMHLSALKKSDLFSSWQALMA